MRTVLVGLVLLVLFVVSAFWAGAAWISQLALRLASPAG